MPRHYNALANVPWQVMSDIRDRIEAMPEGKEKKILDLYFVSGLSSSEVVRYCEENDIRSRNNTFFTKRSIQNIVAKCFPEIKQYRKSNPDNEKRKTHFQYINSHERVRCGKCGGTENLEWHHMIPLSFGGEADDGNMVCLCKECHKKATEYARVFLKREPDGGA